MKNIIICEDKKLSDMFEGYKTSDLLNTWKEIQGDGAKCSKDQIEAMGNLISEYRLGIFSAFDRK